MRPSALPHNGVTFELFIGVIIIVSGAIFLLQETGVVVEGFDVLWPIIVVVFGILFVAGIIYGLTRR